MGQTLSFLADNNSLIIKVLSVFIALIAAFLLYRLIFAKEDTESSQFQSSKIAELNKKISEHLQEIATLKSANDIANAEIEKLRTEIYNLRQLIKEKENPSAAQPAGGDPITEGAKGKEIDYEVHKSEVILSTKDEKLVYLKEIDELKRRLSDYEIIAEDISDMQKLKEENEKLKQQIAPAEVVEEKVASPEAEIVATGPIETQKVEEKSDIETETLAPGPSDVSEIDKTLIDKFEKIEPLEKKA